MDDIYKNILIGSLTLFIILMGVVEGVQHNEATLGQISKYECTQAKVSKGKAICTTLELKEE